MIPVIESLRFDRTSFLESVKMPDGQAPEGIVSNLRSYSGNLQRVEMTKLSGVVVIAGPNGSGKSRTLNLLRHIVDVASATWLSQMPPPEGSEDGTYIRCVQIRSDLQPLRVNLPSHVVPIRPVASATQADYDVSAKKLDSAASEFEDNGGLAAIMAKQCHSEMWDAQHQHSSLSSSRQLELKNRWENWCALVRDLLKKELRVEGSRQLFIGDLPIDEAINYFSEGEKRLFSLSASLVCGNTNNRRRVIICDEPENHLHPDAAVEVLIRIRDTLADDQLWIATHSLPIIAALGWENVFVAQSGQIAFGGRDTDRIVDGLLGGRDNSSRLRALIDEPARAAIVKFAAESLTPPPAATFTQDDPQYQTILDEAKRSQISILDWGAGSGRLPFYISMQAQSFRQGVEYFSYEPDREKHESCQNCISKLGPFVEPRLFGSMDELRSARLFGSFDRVLLCNVLHEIPVASWIETFAAIAASLADNGALVILEDSQIPIGELPTEEGFLLLTLNATKVLFGSHETIREIPNSDTKYRERLKGFYVPKASILSASNSTLVSAIAEIGSAALSSIDAVRSASLTEKAPSNYKSGLSHAINLVQFANAEIALQRLKKD